MNKEKIIYYINVEDIQTVAEEKLGRDISEEELKLVEDKVGDYIGWFEAISTAINNAGIK